MIKNIIFDLGGVIINIDYKKTLNAFAQLGANNIEEIYSQSKQDPLFNDYETGKISSAQFRKQLKIKLDIIASDKEFDTAWNAMLLDLPGERIRYIKQLSEQHGYNVFLFSNTNEIHLKAVYDIHQKQNNQTDFNGVFTREYYSHLFGQRKPNTEAFISILSENSLNADETLFIDDSYQHIEGAQKAGIHAVHLTKEATILDTMSFIEKINVQSIQNEQSGNLLMVN